MDSKKFGEFLAKLRKSRKLTQKQLGEIINCDDKTISKWECGNYAPDIMYLKPLSDALEISVSELLECGLNKENSINGELKNNNIIMNIKKYESAAKKYVFKRMILLLGIVSIILSFVIIYVQKNQWNLYNINTNNSHFYINGTITYNNDNSIYNITNIYYNSEFVGTIDEPMVTLLKASVYNNDKLICTKELAFENPTFIHRALNNIFISENVKNNKFDKNNFRIEIDYLDENNEEHIENISL